MGFVYDIFKAIADPIFFLFVLLIISFIIFWKTSNKKTGALILLLTIILFYGASIPPVANYLCHYLEKDYIKKAETSGKNLDALVVLGGSSYKINYLDKSFPSSFTMVRLAYAVDYYHKNSVKYFVCSGKGPATLPEAEMMARLAVSFGVPKEKIRTDIKSTSTWQNAAEIDKMFADKNIAIGLVTSAYHMKRSEKEFRKYFNNIVPLPAGYLYSSPAGNPVVKYLPQSESLYKTSLAIKEIMAQMLYNIKSLF
ncbi:MAG TPA: YdcF family protein [Smithellaceae bacterium]|nr:YdcF family protein [Smithellaceae bacterium]HRS89400.1 YdcF family protein [Smithellaceae bacterium]HRV26190.1 YdcF family protein [Smithellaceae bacterium]